LNLGEKNSSTFKDVWELCISEWLLHKSNEQTEMMWHEGWRLTAAAAIGYKPYLLRAYIWRMIADI